MVETTRGNAHVRVRLSTELPGTRAKLWLVMEGSRSGGTELYAQRALVSRDNVRKVPGRGVYTESARLERLDFAREISGAPLAHLQQTTLVAEKLSGNIEHLIGGVEVPVGLAGPLLFSGQRAKGIIYAPFATTEGALVASATRGATAITRSGGVSTRVISQRMMRVPFFIMSDMQGAFLFASWVRDHIHQLREEVRKVSEHANLVSIEPHLIGNMVHVSFVYETGDAAGQNMTTCATWHGCQWLMRQMEHYPDIHFERFFLDGNMSGDKKVTFKSFISGRGTRVTAECFLHEKVCEEVLKTTPLHLVKCNQWSMASAVQTGTVGYNINIANVIAAMFTATGQDIASVHESSVGVLSMETVKNGVHVSLLLPSIIVGTVGGGTHVPRQSELLQVMDCAGPGKASRLAEIIAGYCLALDLSTMSALATGQFASAHERLGRNRPVRWLGPGDLPPQFFEPGLRRALHDDQAYLI
ncbi:MAG: hydroxymethylglutaryl-CoA reductase, partial [Polyangiaceae bacterium]|nr:hydroxymethylglutaryl-CoA reductase [Polyangiaceae bacterium]